MTAPDSPRPVFISYAHKDNENSDPAKRWLDRLKEQLEPLLQQGNLTVYSDQDIGLGDDWREHIQTHLNGTRAAVLLVSPAFLASKYIRNNELPVLLRDAKARGVKIIPVILRPCLFEETKFKYPDPNSGPEEFTLASLQAAGSPKKALSEMTEGEQDRALLCVAQALINLAHAAHSASGTAAVPLKAIQSPPELPLEPPINSPINNPEPRTLSATPLGTDIFTPLEAGIKALLDKLGESRPEYDRVLNLQLQLDQNLWRARTVDHPELRAERAGITEQLNRISRAVLGITFRDLCPRI